MGDLELLEQYVQERSEAAFAELVRRHIGWVHLAAVRQVRGHELAEDVTQAVFIALAQRAGKLVKVGRPVAPWLFQVLRYAALTAVRAEGRRRRHEQGAAAMKSEMGEKLAQAEWEQVAPLLDELVARLGARDRQAVLLRFYERKGIAEVGKKLGVSEAAAQKRIERAVEKLRGMFGRRGVAVVSGAALVAGLDANTVWSVNTAMAAATTKIALAAGQGGAVAGQLMVIAKGATKMMAWGKVRVAALVLAAAGVLGGVGAGVAASGGAGSGPAAPAGPPYAIAATPGEESGSIGNVVVYGYSVGVEDPVARQLRAGRTAAPGSGSYQVYLADAEEIRGVLLREMAAGNVQPAQSGNLSMGVDPARPANLGGQSVSFYNSASTHWGIAGNAMFGQGTQAGLDGTGNVVLKGSLRFARLSAADPRWRGAGRDLSGASVPLNVAIAPGQAAMAILDLGFVGNARRSHVVVFAPMRLSKEESVTVRDMDYPEAYLRLGTSGIRQISQHGRQWKAAATQPSNPGPAAEWEQGLSDGTTIRLAAIGRPRHWPMLMWNPDGNPTVFSCGWPDHDPTGGQHSSVEETVLRIEVRSPHPIGYGMNQMPMPEAARHGGYQQASWNNAFSSIGVRMGVGPWQSAGIIKEGKTYTIGDTRVLIEKIEQDGGQRVRYRVLDRSELCLTFAAVSKTGERKWADHCDYAFMNGSGVKLQQVPTQYAYQALVTTAMGPRPDDDPIELLWRKAETVRFDGFATQPGRLPPFDLGRDSRVVAKPEPTRMATTRPAGTDTPAADMKRMLEAAARGDVAGVEAYLIGGSPEKVGVYARFIARGQQASDEFEKRYGKPLGGRLGQISSSLRRLTEERKYALGDNGSASSGDVRFVKSAAGTWQADLSEEGSELDVRQMQIVSGVVEPWLEMIKAGEHADAEDAQRALDEMIKAEIEAGRGDSQQR